MRIEMQGDEEVSLDVVGAPSALGCVRRFCLGPGEPDACASFDQLFCKASSQLPTDIGLAQAG